MRASLLRGRPIHIAFRSPPDDDPGRDHRFDHYRARHGRRRAGKAASFTRRPNLQQDEYCGAKFGRRALAHVLDTIGRVIARYLEKPVRGYEPFTPSDPAALRKSLELGDVLLVEGNSHISRVIKYLTQSTWSHAALYVGPIESANTDEGEPHVLIEAEIGEGVVSAPLSKYYRYHTRICRPVGLSQEDCGTVCNYAIDRIGFDYDLRHILELMRYLVPLPVPQRWRRRIIALGSGDPTRIICSALIAQAFEAVRYPILPKITRAALRKARREILHIRDSSLYMPRDFDISPYFEIVKPTIVHGFDYTALHWADKQKPLQEVAGEFGVFPETVAPPLAPEAFDEKTPLPAAEVEPNESNLAA